MVGRLHCAVGGIRKGEVEHDRDSQHEGRHGQKHAAVGDVHPRNLHARLAILSH